MNSSTSDTPQQPTGYGQLCAIAMAMDAVGQRWSLLILRDLLRTPLRFSDLQAINPTMSPTMLTQRLRSLESTGLIEKRSGPGPGRTSLYALTVAAQPVLATVLTALADLGAHMLEQDPPTGDPSELMAQQMRHNGHFIMARRTQLQGYFVLDLTGWETHIVIDQSGFDASAEAPRDTPPDATAVFFPPTTMLRLMGQVLTVEEAEAAGLLAISGNREPMMELIRLLSFPAP